MTEPDASYEQGRKRTGASTLVFDIETIPDIPALRRFYELDEGLSDEKALEFAQDARRLETYNGSDFLRHHFHKIVCISVVYRAGDEVHIRSLGSENSSEEDLIKRFFGFIDRHDVTLVSWNGGKFDLPVLNYRGLLYGVQAPTYWDQGTYQYDFRYNNYINRYHSRHTDLMDTLSMFQPGAFQTLDHISTFLGFPGKYGVDGSQVHQMYLDGRIREIREYCESDVLNTYLVYLRYQLMRGVLSLETHQDEIALLRRTLEQSQADHLHGFLHRWDQI